jgi:hypothetical protein
VSGKGSPDVSSVAICNVKLTEGFLTAVALLVSLVPIAETLLLLDVELVVFVL